MRLTSSWILLAGSLLVVAALYNHYFGHSAYLVEMIFVVCGGTLALYSLWMRRKESPAAEEGIVYQIACRIFGKDRYRFVLPSLGFLIILVWTVWKVFVVSKSDLHLEDFVVTSLGLSLALYGSAPTRFAPQKDFVVLYLFFMAVVFVIIWNGYLLMFGSRSTEVTAKLQYKLVTVPVVMILNLLGVSANAVLDLSRSGLTNFIEYEFEGKMIVLGVGPTCSGLYSAGLFFSAFLAFVLVRYKKVDRRILLGLAAGLAVTWFSNVLRMVVTVWVGSVYGHPALALFHAYFGILLFVLFVAVFWILIVRWLDKAEKGIPTSKQSVSEGMPE